MTRELVLDTETTGLDHEDGHRIIEIGIVELENHLPTGNYFHYYLNPERDSDKRAQEVHGLSREFLKDKPKFSEIADEFINYISDSKIIIHNASFDVGFLNAELIKCNMKELNDDKIIDTLVLAKRKFVGQSVSLDSLCRKFNIVLSAFKIDFPLPDELQIQQILSLKLRGVRRQFELDDKSILGIFSTKSGADIERIVRRAVKRMILRSQEFLTVKDLKQAASRES